MSRFQLKIFGYITYLLSTFFLTVSNNCKAQNQKPNIILILADDVGYKSLTCNGGNLYSTPNIDALAQNGMRFTECYATPLCSPSRIMLLTGKYSFRNYTKWGYLDTAQKTIGNIFVNAGYKTACFGKWQLEGGDESIRKFGFQDYTVHDALDRHQRQSRYKDPHLYTYGSFIEDSLTKEKYGPDIVSDSVLSFIDNNKSNPFFIYYSMISVHEPFSPTPDDFAFKEWSNENEDTSFFPSMMSYMDKMIGKLIDKLIILGIEKNTVIIFCGDNGTPHQVADYANENGNTINGKKGSTKKAGMHVPLIVNWPQTVAPGSVNNDLIDFSDFLPTLAGIANIPVPGDYGTLDGVDFSERLTGGSGSPRGWSFCSFLPHPEDAEDQLKRFAQTTTYKLYDTSSSNKVYLFYNIVTDPNERKAIPDNLLTFKENEIKQQLLSVINNYVAQDLPILSKCELLSVSDSSAIIGSKIETNGGSTITAHGVVWSINHNPLLSGSNYTSEDGYQKRFNSLITGLKANTTYYTKTYAVNVAGTAYGKEISFTTRFSAPVCTNATRISNTGFIANWTSLNNVSNYEIDVSVSREFSANEPYSVIEGFDNGLIPSDGWRFGKGLIANTKKFGNTSPSIEFSSTTRNDMSTPTYTGRVNQLSFFIIGSKADNGSLLLEGLNDYGNFWQIIENITNVSKTPAIKTYNFDSPGELKKQKFIKFRFTYTKSGEGSILIDDVVTNYNLSKPSFVPGYENLKVNSDSIKIDGLEKDKRYYYRVRAKYVNDISGNSNTISVKTRNMQLDTPLCIEATNIFRTSFIANWNKLKGADSYKIDVSTEALFSKPISLPVIEAFNNGTQPPDGWVFSKELSADTMNFGKSSPSIRFKNSNERIVTSVYPAAVTRLGFFIKGLKQNAGSLLVEGFNGTDWKTIDSITNITTKRLNKTYNSASSPVLKNNFIKFRFTFTRLAGTIILDDVTVRYPSSEPSFVPGYKDLTVNNNSLKIAGLEDNTKYYYRVRGICNDLDDTSAYSNTINVITNDDPNSVASLQSENINKTFRQLQKDKQLFVKNYPNPAIDEFTLTIQSGSDEPVMVIVTDSFGKLLYQSAGNTRHILGNNFPAGTYLVKVTQGNVVKTIKLVKTSR